MLRGSERPAVIANLSARVGSIGDNSMGGWYAYRASKTALNQLTKTMSVEFGRRKQLVSCILLHPGTVDTDLSAPFQKVRSLLYCRVYIISRAMQDGALAMAKRERSKNLPLSVFIIIYSFKVSVSFAS